jgi:hypothetical protein
MKKLTKMTAACTDKRLLQQQDFAFQMYFFIAV